LKREHIKKGVDERMSMFFYCCSSLFVFFFFMIANENYLLRGHEKALSFFFRKV